MCNKDANYANYRIKTGSVVDFVGDTYRNDKGRGFQDERRLGGALIGGVGSMASKGPQARDRPTTTRNSMHRVSKRPRPSCW